MGGLAQLVPPTVDVEPGGGATVVVRVRNTGTVVDRFQFEVLGATAGWAHVTPATLSLFPQAEGVVNITFAPPRVAAVTSGPTPFGLRIISTEDPEGTTVEEGTLNVGAFSDVTTELIPRVVTGRRAGRAQLAVDNRSNVPYRAELAVNDPEMAVGVGFRPSVIDVLPGEAAFVKLMIRPRRRFWRGPTRNHPYRVLLREDLAASLAPDQPVDATAPAPPEVTPAAGPDPSPAVAPTQAVPAVRRAPSVHKAEITADGSMLQQPLLPGWLPKAVAAVVALALIAVILWFTLLKPQIKDQAKAQVNKQLTAAGITPTTPTPTPAGGKTPAGGSAGGGSPPAGGGSSSSTGTATTGGGLTINGSLTAAGNGTRTYNVPTGKILQVTDLLVENSAGDTGNITLSKDSVVLMQWSMANFRDLDYHWITPTIFAAGSQMQLVVSGCTNVCTPSIYYAGTLATAAL